MIEALPRRSTKVAEVTRDVKLLPGTVVRRLPR